MEVSADDNLSFDAGGNFDDGDVSFGCADGNDGAADGGASSDPSDDTKPLDHNPSESSGGVFGGLSQNNGIGAFGVMGRQPSNNNFVTKLYQSVSPPSSRQTA